VTSDEAIDRLRQLLAVAGVDLVQPASADVSRAWDVMRQFAREPVEDAQPSEDDGDGILAQYGIDERDGSPVFMLDMTRQFTFADEHGEYSHMTQLFCEFQFAVTDELRALGEDDLWSFQRPLDEFFDEALDMPGFRGVRELEVAPLRLSIGYGQI
jgi:hypothetical protein